MTEQAQPSVPSGMDGYFAPAVAAAPVFSAPQQGGWSAPPEVLRRSLSAEPPMWVVAAATVLVLTGVAAGWLGLTMLVMVDAVGIGLREEGVTARALLLLVNAAVNAGLAHQLLRGQEAARWAASGVCGWWLLYWLWKCSQLSDLSGALSASALPSGVGNVGAVLTLGVLLLGALAAGTGGLLWTSGASDHFSRR